MGAANTGNGAGGHSEERILEQLRIFVRELEAVAIHGTTLHVTTISVRMITDWIPDFSHQLAFCTYAIKWVSHMAAEGWFRQAQFTDAVRLGQAPWNGHGAAVPAGGPAGWNGNPTFPRRQDLNAIAAGAYGAAVATNRIAFTLIGDYLYEHVNGVAGGGQQQKRLAAWNAAGGHGAVPDAANEALGAGRAYGYPYELHNKYAVALPP
jgi:hypothetical protein